MLWNEFQATVNAFFRTFGLKKHIETVWSKGYLKLVRLVPTYDLMFEGFEGVSNRCAVAPIWKSLWKMWIELENTIRKISAKVKVLGVSLAYNMRTRLIWLTLCS